MDPNLEIIINDTDIAPELKDNLKISDSFDVYLRQCAELLSTYKSLTIRYERIITCLDYPSMICQTVSTLGVASIFATNYASVGGAIAITCNVASTLISIVKKNINPESKYQEYLSMRNQLTNLLDSMLEARNKKDLVAQDALKLKVQGIVSTVSV